MTIRELYDEWQRLQREHLLAKGTREYDEKGHIADNAADELAQKVPDLLQIIEDLVEGIGYRALNEGTSYELRDRLRAAIGGNDTIPWSETMKLDPPHTPPAASQEAS